MKQNPKSELPTRRGMARALTVLTMRRSGALHLRVKTAKGVLDVPEAANLLRVQAPSPWTICCKMRRVRQGVILGKPKDKQILLKAADDLACSVEKLGELKFRLV